ncbi:creatininase [Alkalibacillus haloalkaliphilus]|uniref:Creatininase n=1 Tax=Alkalibacillus haloalkaliphilus TaxID=94136 RepID=A0A511W3C9_9BACI|nr:creatininase [Alkalibacillus haloalkaliphilus]GEN45457.1 creatininase [Alkalibacillus haloalkaliphilus]
MTVLMSEMTWPEYESKVQDAVVLLPVGSTEQHSYHLPLGVDYYQINEISKLVATSIDGIVAPAIPFGYKSLPHSGGGQTFPGTTSLSAETLILLVKDILVEFIRHGAEQIIVMDGHYENGMFLSEAIDLALKESNQKSVKILKASFVDMLDDEVVTPYYKNGFPGYSLEHAAFIETALMMKLKPDLVQQDKIEPAEANLPRYEVFPQQEGVVPKSGSLADPTGATKEAGEIFVNNIVGNYVQSIKKEFNIT